MGKERQNSRLTLLQGIVYYVYYLYATFSSFSVKWQYNLCICIYRETCIGKNYLLEEKTAGPKEESLPNQKVILPIALLVLSWIEEDLDEDDDFPTSLPESGIISSAITVISIGSLGLAMVSSSVRLRLKWISPVETR